ncbi:hypothetical protein [Caballeronia glathei]|uniref:Uncharacterized protein n=1 Tax=Caballeronia glathei TaxID=60547 RepID=A0A069PBF5_9BURK|nr:hypothetical protein [Caballeronia glathei]KDR37822.1 hypothetical protein BG61_06920 [Caballeronia glathei]
MLINATPMRVRGKALEHYEVQKTPGVRGDMIVVQEKSTALNRYSNIARFQVTGVSDPQPMPPLHDAVLSWMGPNGFVLSGIEFVDGVSCAQSWWCRPA